jgi:membrane-associated phospholipid phosphatase
MRGLGVPVALGDLLGPFVVVFALVTQLGDLWFLTLLVTLPYWLGRSTPRVGAAIDRERAATVVALLFGSIALLTTLKPIFGVPRPPGADVAPQASLVPAVLDGLYAWLSTGDGFGFPSGHALGTTIVFGGLAWAVRVGSRRGRIAVAAALVTLVSFSRLALGVHYLVDVVAGAAVGLAYLAIVLGVLDSPRDAFGFATAVTLLGLVVVEPGPELVAAVGLCAGGTVAWLAVGDRLSTLLTTGRPGSITAALGLLVAAPLLSVVGLVHLSVPVAFLGGFAGGAVVVALPLVGDGVGKRSW